jgi:hypothetical protein
LDDICAVHHLSVSGLDEAVGVTPANAAASFRRQLGGLTARKHHLPKGTIAAYYPECNVLIAIDHDAQMSKTPASKAIPVRIEW